MTFQPKTLICCDCKNNFIFSAEQQELFQSRGFGNQPQRCLTCRQMYEIKHNENNAASQNKSGFTSDIFGKLLRLRQRYVNPL